MLAVKRVGGLVESAGDVEDSAGNLVPAGDSLIVGRFLEPARGRNGRLWKVSKGADAVFTTIRPP